MQADLDAIDWYHDIDFPSGLRAVSRLPDIDGRRRLWGWLDHELDAKVEFESKTVLDVGCWDGRFSFFAESRGAASVLAVDDLSQRWGTGRGLEIARKELESSIDVRLDQSIYELGTLQRTFDIILCLGVYYHLDDPMAGFRGLRSCCHEGTRVVIEGDVLLRPSRGLALLGSGEREDWAFIPTRAALRKMLEAGGLDIKEESLYERFPAANLVKRLLPGRPRGRILLVCSPRQGT